MPTVCNIKQKSEPIWVLLTQSALTDLPHGIRPCRWKTNYQAVEILLAPHLFKGKHRASRFFFVAWQLSSIFQTLSSIESCSIIGAFCNLFALSVTFVLPVQDLDLRFGNSNFVLVYPIVYYCLSESLGHSLLFKRAPDYYQYFFSVLS